MNIIPGVFTSPGDDGDVILVVNIDFFCEVAGVCGTCDDASDRRESDELE